MNDLKFGSTSLHLLGGVAHEETLRFAAGRYEHHPCNDVLTLWAWTRMQHGHDSAAGAPIIQTPIVLDEHIDNMHALTALNTWTHELGPTYQFIFPRTSLQN